MPISPLALSALLALAAWLMLLGLRGGFWRADQRLPPDPAPPPEGWPDIVAVVPARNEAATIADAVESLLDQDYPGRLDIVVVDDDSDDETAAAARGTGGDAEAGRVTVVAGRPLPAGWTGKVWALDQGVATADEAAPEARFLWLTDADIVHAPDTLRRLVAWAESGGRDLVSLMVRLRCVMSWEILLVPAFVFFFQKLYPFPWVNDPARPTAAAAGGCVLLRRAALARIGGMAAIRDRVIDDCALAAAVKPGGPVWLGLTEDSRSLRGYDGLAGLWNMVARSAFAQLRGSLPLLAVTVLGMALLYLVPPLVAIAGVVVKDWTAGLLGALGWGAMALAYRPTLALYERPWWEASLLPHAAAFYAAMTVDSAWRSLTGRGGEWKGRRYPAAANRAK